MPESEQFVEGRWPGLYVCFANMRGDRCANGVNLHCFIVWVAVAVRKGAAVPTICGDGRSLQPFGVL
jgi:hypothetical protein